MLFVFWDGPATWLIVCDIAVVEIECSAPELLPACALLHSTCRPRGRLLALEARTCQVQLRQKYEREIAELKVQAAEQRNADAQALER